MAIGVDVLFVVLTLATLKLRSDPWVVVTTLLSFTTAFAFERLYSSKRRQHQREAPERSFLAGILTPCLVQTGVEWVR